MCGDCAVCDKCDCSCNTVVVVFATVSAGVVVCVCLHEGCASVCECDLVCDAGVGFGAALVASGDVDEDTLCVWLFALLLHEVEKDEDEEAVAEEVEEEAGVREEV